MRLDHLLSKEIFHLGVLFQSYGLTSDRLGILIGSYSSVINERASDILLEYECNESGHYTM